MFDLNDSKKYIENFQKSKIDILFWLERCEKDYANVINQKNKKGKEKFPIYFAYLKIVNIPLKIHGII